MTTCTNHCGPCGRHFHSLAAFDIHKQHDADGWPHCLDPLDLQDRDGRQRLEALTHAGRCEAYEPVRLGVTVWTTAGSRERLSRAFGTGSVSLTEAA